MNNTIRHLDNGDFEVVPDSFTVRTRWGHLDKMPRCATCGRVVCRHEGTDAFNDAPGCRSDYIRKG